MHYLVKRLTLRLIKLHKNYRSYYLNNLTVELYFFIYVILSNELWVQNFWWVLIVYEEIWLSLIKKYIISNDILTVHYLVKILILRLIKLHKNYRSYYLNNLAVALYFYIHLIKSTFSSKIFRIFDESSLFGEFEKYTNKNIFMFSTQQNSQPII